MALDDPIPTRRTLLHRGAGALATAVAAATAGCASALPPLGSAQRFGRIDVPDADPPDYRRWLPTPAADLPDERTRPRGDGHHDTVYVAAVSGDDVPPGARVRPVHVVERADCPRRPRSRRRIPRHAFARPVPTPVMADVRRDGLLALVTLCVLVVAGARLVGVSPFLHPLAVGVGVLGAIGIEWGFLVSPTLAAGWERRGVPLASALTVLAVAAAVTPHAPWLAGAAAWGLVTYGCLLACVLVGWGNPVAWLPTDRDR
jgi:hypothetical protein